MSKKRGVKHVYTLDKLTLCYTANDSIIEQLNDITDLDLIDFKLKRTKSNIVNENRIDIYVQNPNDLKFILFGTLCYDQWKKGSNNDTLIWLYYNNKVFYTEFLKKTNIIVFTDYISNNLGLEINNFTNMDIACDSNVNYAKKLKKAIFDENFTPIVNGTERSDPNEVIQEIQYLMKANQKRMTDLTIYLKQNYDKGFELRCYDKEDEINDVSGKEYIKDWVDLKKPHRSELSLKYKQLKEHLNNNPNLQKYFYHYEDLNIEMMLPYLGDGNFNFLEDMFKSFVNRLIRFKDKKTGNILTIFDL